MDLYDEATYQKLISKGRNSYKRDDCGCTIIELCPGIPELLHYFMGNDFGLEVL